MPTRGYLGAMFTRLSYAFPLCLAVAAPAWAETRAVIVGVSDYLVLDADLKGPSADAALMAETLLARGLDPAAVTVLASSVDGLPAGVTTGQPTRDEILAALQAASAASASGDTVVFYFSGHGSQAPDASGDEGSGHDEILLPADAAGWKGAIGAVENALVDDELQAWAQALMDRGVKVVGLIDACHSATGFRAIGGEGVARVLDPEVLGIPNDAASAPATAALELTGDYVFLYSSQSDERSFEYPYGEDGLWHGEFTLRLAQVLAAAPQASWRQVLDAATDAMVQGPARQMPEGEGPLLDAQVFGTGTAEPRFALAGDRVEAGLLQGLEPGAELALFAAGAGGEPLGYVTVAKADARSATVTGDIPAGAAWVELSAAAPAKPLSLAAPVRADEADGQDYAGWEAALPAPGADPDLVPILVDGTVALANADGVLDPEGPGSSPRILREEGETEAEAVERALEIAAHGLRLRQTLAGAAKGRGLTDKPVIEMAIERRPAAVTAEGCGKAGPGAPADPGQGVAPCDQLWLTLTNRSGKAQDVSVLYYATDFTVSPIWPHSNLANRLQPGESVTVGLQIDPGSQAGLEEIWVLAVPEEDEGGRIDLTRLSTPQMTRAYAGASSDMALWIEGRMIDPAEAASRGFSLKPAPLVMIRQVVRLQRGEE
ncbi:MAG: caspase family protein [Fuscovulum sp.]|nr:caspase family protein [Fuscovulum sp.]